MRVTRRSAFGFLAAAALAGVTGCEIDDVARLVDSVRADARIGVIAHLEDYGTGNLKALENVLRFYGQQGADVIAVAGSVTRDQADLVRQARLLAFGTAARPRLVFDGRQEANGFAFGVAKTPPQQPCDILTFHGEGQGALTDDLAFFDADYGVVYSGSLSAIPVPEGFSRNGRSSTGGDRVNCRQGLLVSVYPDKVKIRRLDFTHETPPSGFADRSRVYAEDVAPELVLPRTPPWTVEKAVAPEFWPDTVLRLLPGYSGADRIYTLRWPAVQKRFTGVRAFCYEVCVHRMKPGGDKPSRAVRSKTVLTEAYHLSELRDTQPVACVFRQKDLVAAARGDPVVLSVTPIGPRGDRGRPLLTETFTP